MKKLIWPLTPENSYNTKYSMDVLKELDQNKICLKVLDSYLIYYEARD